MNLNFGIVHLFDNLVLKIIFYNSLIFAAFVIVLNASQDADSIAFI